MRLLLATLGLLWLQGGAAVLAAEKKPNILLIVADDLGFSDLGCYGGEIATPHLDRLAKDGLRLTQFYTTGRCCPSRASLLTGQYPHRVGHGHMIKDIGLPGYRGFLPEGATTLAQVLNRVGYRSFLSGKWHLGGITPIEGGFEQWYGTPASAKTFWDPAHYQRLPEGAPRRSYREGEFFGTDALVDHALDFLGLARETEGKPWFLYLAFNAPHFPLHAPAEDIAKYKGRYTVGWDAIRAERTSRAARLGVIPAQVVPGPRSRFWDWGEEETGSNPAWESLPADRRADLARRMAIYAAMVDRMDRNIGRVMDNLRAAGELANTLVIFLSDNGACAEWDPFGFDIKSSTNNILHSGDQLARMGQAGTFHSAGSGWANASNTPWRLYKHFTHEGGISGPCIVHWPAGIVAKGRIDHGPCHLVDILPTMAEVTGAAETGKLALPGKSLLPAWRGRESSARTLYFEHEGHRAIREGRWKLVALKNEPWELYEMEEDRAEARNLASREPERVRRMAGLWEAWATENFVTPWPEDYGVTYARPPRR